MASRVEWIGLRSGRLQVLAADGRNRHGQVMYRCRCDCGAEARRAGNSLRAGTATSCGCLTREKAKLRKPNLVHGHARGSDGRRPRTYETWLAMITRCHRPTASDFPRYGARGIAVCDRWRNDFEAFLADMGERPQRMTLDRKDGDLGYTPENCRWATQRVQSRNKRTVVFTIETAREAMKLLEAGERTAEVARRFGVTPSCVTGLKQGKAWKELPPFTPAAPRKSCVLGRKITYDNAVEIMGRLEHGEAPKSVAERFQVSVGMVRHIRDGRAWRDVPAFMSMT